MSTQISIVIPLFNEEESLPDLIKWIHETLHDKYSYEVIFVDDGSRDQSWKIVSDLKQKYEQIHGIRFRRNYGKSAALNEGFKMVKGKVVITMDADLQDSPEEIPELYRRIDEEGYDLISGWKQKRYDPISKTIPSKFFNGVTGWVSGIKLHDFNCGLKAYNAEVVKSIEIYGEMHRYIPVIAKKAGFDKIGEQVVAHRARKYGHTKFGLERFVNGFLDLLSITFVTRFANSPMHLFGSVGTLSFILGFIMTIYIIGDKLISIQQGLKYRDVVDQPLFYLSLLAIVIGVQLFLTGFLAELISRNNPERSNYQIKEWL